MSIQHNTVKATSKSSVCVTPRSEAGESTELRRATAASSVNTVISSHYKDSLSATRALKQQQASVVSYPVGVVPVSTTEKSAAEFPSCCIFHTALKAREKRNDFAKEITTSKKLVI